MTIRVGIIGTGSIADDAHAPAIRSVSGAELAAVLSRNEGRGRQFLDRHEARNGRVFTDLASFASEAGVDLVIIASPDRLHFKQALACLDAGKHVLLEKPMAVTVAEAAELQRRATERGVKLAIGFHLRAHHGHRALHEAVVERNAIGKLRHVRAIWAFPQNDADNWRAKRELGKWWSLAAVGAHCVDLARWYANDFEGWAEFGAATSRAIWGGVHDETAVIAGRFSNGVTAEVVSSVQFGPYARLELFGAKGVAIAENTFGRKGAGAIAVNGEPLAFTAEPPFAPQLKLIVAAIERGDPLPADAGHGLRNVKDLIRTDDA